MKPRRPVWPSGPGARADNGYPAASSSEQRPTHRYSAKGRYTVSLTVTDKEGAQSTASQSLTVLNAPPTAPFSWQPDTPAPGDTVHFMEQSTDPDGTGDIVAWNWDFGDGAGSTERHPSHTFDKQGSYAVRLTVTDAGGAGHAATREVLVNARPIAAFTYSPIRPRPGQAVQFTDRSSDVDGQVVEWQWDFGDGTSAAERHATHAFTWGSYIVTLVVRDNLGARSDAA